MKMLLKSALFLMPLVALNLGAVEPTASSQALKGLACFKQLPEDIRLLKVRESEPGKAEIADFQRFDFSKVPSEFRDQLATAFSNKEMSLEMFNEILKNRASEIAGFRERIWINGQFQKIICFNNAPREIVYYSKPSRMAQLLMVSGAIGAVTSAYYYRDSLKPIVQNFWDKQVTPRMTSLVAYMKRK